MGIVSERSATFKEASEKAEQPSRAKKAPKNCLSNLFLSLIYETTAENSVKGLVRGRTMAFPNRERDSVQLYLMAAFSGVMAEVALEPCHAGHDFQRGEMVSGRRRGRVKGRRLVEAENGGTEGRDMRVEAFEKRS